ncbi:hypothetical protein IscW_ISCW005522 [Ixodes scapularis]|uniref:Uncharacterized protein n=1 Tax=Ixodes scapularis TaxID=6945 RepID=B7PPJ7_IXOSC|nr:hypothetical protein IscW_ISCW005522 [Ixodes scapularis]|eukprot:XP_002435689.1 hypothetical protein IscW_ISCW005522 [Ixodes scapularis]
MTVEEDYVWRPVQIAPKAPNQKALRMGFLLVSALLTTSSIALLKSALLRLSGLKNRALTAHHKRSAGMGIRGGSGARKTRAW